MIIDYERVLLRMKEELTRKPSHSAKDLLAKLGELEVECQLPESEHGFDGRPLPTDTPRHRATERPLSTV